MEWAGALWSQIKGIVPPDPWDNDPDIIEARVRQDQLGVTQAVSRWSLEQEFWRKRLDRRYGQQEARRADTG